MREAIAAAQARIASQRIATTPTSSPGEFGKVLAAGSGPTAPTPIASSEATASKGPSALDAITRIDAEVQRAEGLGADLITGKVQDIHEVAAQLKRADLTFKFSLQVRDRLIDAYREVMRMGV